MKKNVVFKVLDMHCTSCAMNIDMGLEDTEGIISSNTNYAKQQTKVEFYSDKISENKIAEIIKSLGYKPQIKD